MSRDAGLEHAVVPAEVYAVAGHPHLDSMRWHTGLEHATVLRHVCRGARGDIDSLLSSAPLRVVNEPGMTAGVIFVIRVLTREEAPSEVQSLDDVREQLRGQLFQQKLVAVEEEWYQRARRESAVSVVLEVE